MQRPGEHLLRKGLLGGARWEGDALLGMAIVVGGAGKDLCVWVARRPRGDVVKASAPQHHDCNSVGTCIAIGRRIKGFTCALHSRRSSIPCQKIATASIRAYANRQRSFLQDNNEQQDRLMALFHEGDAAGRTSGDIM